MSCSPDNKMHVLVVDDEEDMCWVFQSIIEAEGHTLTIAKNAAAALLALQQESFGMVFVDAKLPDMEGFDLLERIHAMCPKLPCAMVSGYLYKDDDLIQSALSRGLIRSFIGKPFLLADVREVMQHGNRTP